MLGRFGKFKDALGVFWKRLGVFGNVLGAFRGAPGNVWERFRVSGSVLEVFVCVLITLGAYGSVSQARKSGKHNLICMYVRT